MFIWPFSGLCDIVHSEGTCCLVTAWRGSGLGLLAEGWHQFGPVCGTAAKQSNDPSLPDNDCRWQSR